MKWTYCNMKHRQAWMLAGYSLALTSILAGDHGVARRTVTIAAALVVIAAVIQMVRARRSNCVTG